ncbi:alanine racemase [Labrys wisconsinensis]|uniref:Amino acid racemase n=1 Tax=Labrys wisconsinensis TaxID=425677 RepID=A0ABU0JE26_9HYPH|nr:alanine racemase [Labrys wisconsinensis]MDQ0471524.1 putative amino acid racemase [Labrys wisconsinensis]
MFLDLIRRRNPALIEQAIALHQAGRLPANSYVIDLDAVEANARHIAGIAARHGLKAYAMTKQMGRNGSFCRAVARGGIAKAVAVDVECARATHRAGMGLGHVGHLVQVPRFEADAVAALAPDHWTVFNREKAAEAGAAAARRGRTQALLARIVAPGDTFYRGHEGGFAAADIPAVADALDATPGARFAGLTTFPAQLFDHALGQVKPTPNLATLFDAAEALARTGRSGIEINTPGTTSAEILPALAEAGATQIEPGHGLTGTTPLHAVRDLPELPAVVYLSEVSHLTGGEAFCFGGGLYVDPVFPDYQIRAVVAREPTVASLAPVEIPGPASIDYYGMIDATGPVKPRVGDSVVFGFRPQAFVTRAYVVGVAGLSKGEPAVETIHDAFGRPADWPQ